MRNMKTTRLVGISIIITLVIFSFHTDIQADPQECNSEPKFSNYPVTNLYTGKNAPIKLTRENRVFRTRLTKASKEKPDFAGRYILASWGCGHQCLMGGVIDAKTGKVYRLPFSICCWGSDYDDNFEPIDYRIDSKLVIFTGARDMAAGDAGKHFYIFDGKKFVHLSSKIGDLPKGGLPEDSTE